MINTLTIIKQVHFKSDNTKNITNVCTRRQHSVQLGLVKKLIREITKYRSGYDRAFAAHITACVSGLTNTRV